jgi:hypothetical protein
MVVDSAWPAVALVGSYELCMLVIHPAHEKTTAASPVKGVESPSAPVVEREVSPASTDAPALQQAIRARHQAGHSQRAISRELRIDRRTVKRIIEQTA